MSLLTARDAAAYLNVSLATLYRIEREGILMPFRTAGGHRRYSVAMLNEYLESSRQNPLAGRRSTKHVKWIQEDRLPDRAVRILVVDDEPDTVELITQALQEDGDTYRIASASTGYEVGVQVVTFTPDLIVLGMTASATEVVEVCKNIKSYPETQHIMVLGVFEPGEDANVVEMLQCGADDCLIKPLEDGELRRAVRRLASGKWERATSDGVGGEVEVSG